MTASTRETILTALFTLLQTVPETKVLRNEVVPERIPDSGLLILRDGDPGDPEVMLSPLSYYWQHRAQLEVLVQKGTAETRDATLDTLLVSVATLNSLTFTAHEVYLPKPKLSVSGPGGVQATFDWQAAKASASPNRMLTVVLKNDVESYA